MIHVVENMINEQDTCRQTTDQKKSEKLRWALRRLLKEPTLNPIKVH